MKTSNLFSWRHASLLALLIWLPVPSFAGSLQSISATAPTLGAPAGGSGDSYDPVISRDGRYVLFESMANNLTSGGNNSSQPFAFPARMNVFLRDRTNGTTTLVSVNLAGTGGGNGDSMPSAISTNGQYALFESSASNLVAGDTNNANDVFLRDLVNGTTTLISVATNGGGGNGISRTATMTPDGRFVAFVSAANNLVNNDANGIADIFVRDVQSNLTTVVSTGAMATNAAPSACLSDQPEITPDGRFVAFYSSATNLVAGVRTAPEIYVRDLIAGITTLASVSAPAAAKAAMNTTNVISYNHALSADGQYVAYETSPKSSIPTSYGGVILRYNMQTGVTDLITTNANGLTGDYDEVRNLDMTPDGRFIVFNARTNISPGISNTCVLVWDGQSGTTALASGDLNNTVTTNSFCEWPAIDASGRYVAFLSAAGNMTTNALTGLYHLYVHDMQAGTTQMVDADTNGVGSNISPATSPRISEDGRFVAFEAPDGNLVPNDSNHDYDVFARDTQAGITELISVHDPVQASLSPNGPSGISAASLSANGRYVAFFSAADNLVPNDINGMRDVFVRDLLLGTNILVSVDTNGFANGDGPATEPSISANGRYVAFTSGAGNLVSGDTNRNDDVFVRDIQAGTTTLASVSVNGINSGNNRSFTPILSADGNSVLFRSRAGNLSSSPVSTTVDNLYWRNLTSGITYPITTTGVGPAAITPDGRFVAFGSSTNLYLWDSQSATLVYTNAAGTVLIAAISPDGTRLAYIVANRLFGADVVAQTNWTISTQTQITTNRVGLQFSADGRFLAYSTTASQVPNDTNGKRDVYVYDFQARTNLLISQSFNTPFTPNGDSDSPVISADGRFVSYRSQASNIIPGDTNGLPDLFLYDRTTGDTTLLSVSRFGNAAANNWSINSFFSGDGQTLVLQSWASDLVTNDFNHYGDLYAFNLSPASSDIPFSISISFAGTTAQGPTLSWPVEPGKAYQAQFKNNLNDPTWQTLNSSVVIVGNQGYVNDPAPAVDGRFYRLVSF
jgi:hypothetical protein